MHALKVRGRYLAREDGTPFFLLADTAWELFHRLSREEAAYYLTERSRQGFNAVQAVALAELDGLLEPNAYGRLPLSLNGGLPDPRSPDDSGGYSYWSHVDFIVDEAEKRGLYVLLLPTWGDKFNLMWGKGPVVFTEESAFAYGKWIGARYGDRPGIIWMLGGDRALEPPHRRIIDAMAAGIKAGEAREHLMTFHPPGSRNSTEFVGDAAYIDFHTAQTGHDTGKCYRSYAEMAQMALASPKPYLDSEPRYENHPACFRAQYGYFWNAGDVRQNAYWNALSGACGHTYGNHSVWSMKREPDDYTPFRWNEALLHPGAEQMGFVKRLRESRDYFSFEPAPGLVVQSPAGNGFLAAGKGRGYAMAYSPLGLPFLVDPRELEGENVRACWFDPRTGTEEVFGVYPASSLLQFVPPSQGKGQDWVLILDVLD